MSGIAPLRGCGVSICKWYNESKRMDPKDSWALPVGEKGQKGLMAFLSPLLPRSYQEQYRPPSLFLRPVLQPRSGTRDGVREKWPSQAHTFPRGRSWAVLALSWAALGEGWCGKVRLLLLPTRVHPNLYFLLQSCAGPSPLETWTSQAPLTVGDCLRQRFSRAPMAERGWCWFVGPSRVHTWDQGLPAYHQVHAWARLSLGPLTYGAGSHSFHRGTLVCGWTMNCCCGVGVGEEWGTYYSTMMLTSLPEDWVVLQISQHFGKSLLGDIDLFIF